RSPSLRLDSRMQQKPSVDHVLRCSFCNKAQNDVRNLIEGPAVNICYECVETCVDIIVDSTRSKAASPSSADVQRWQSIAPTLRGKRAPCSLCGASANSEDLLPIEGRGVLCEDCADAILDAIAQGRLIR